MVFLNEKLRAAKLSDTLARGKAGERCDYMHTFRYITNVLEIAAV